jgi:intein-encoded DNA endonuclease-like protein
MDGTEVLNMTEAWSQHRQEGSQKRQMINLALDMLNLSQKFSGKLKITQLGLISEKAGTKDAGPN